MMKRRTKRTLAGIATLITGLTLSTAVLAVTIEPGITPSSADVAPSGSFTYSIPVSVPAGVNGLKPDLSLNYNSGSTAAGQLGVGWGLSGTSQITRCDHNNLHDGFTLATNYQTTQNRYCLDGQRLVAMDNAHNSYSIPNRDYRLELDDYTRIRSIGRVGEGPKSFTVWKKSGEVMTYGLVDGEYDSRIEAQGLTDGTVAVWALGSIADRHGNEIRFKYGHDTTTGHFRVEAVDYAFYGEEHQASVRFTYEGNGTRAYDRVIYHGGVRMDTEDRLSKIQTFSRAQAGQALSAVKTYKLGYRDSVGSGRSLLTSVQECAGNGSTACFAPLTFTWGDDDQVFERHNLDSNGSDSSFRVSDISRSEWRKSLAMPLDANGDGISDLVLFPTEDEVTDGKAYLLEGKRDDNGNPRGFSARQDITALLNFQQHPDNAQLTVSDLDADGYSDLVLTKFVITSNEQIFLEVWAFGGSSEGFGAGTLLYRVESTTELEGGFSDARIAFTDYQLSQLSLNGDIYTDFILQYKDDNDKDTTVTLLNTSETGGLSLAASAFMSGSTLPDWWNQSKSQLYTVDFNGDGLSDVISQSTDDKESYLLVNQDTKAGWSDPFVAYPLSGYGGITQKQFSDYNLVTTDFNGDGLTDLLVQHDENASNASKHSTLLVATGSRDSSNLFKAQSLQSLPNIAGNAADTNAMWASNYRTITPFDVNGDGLGDLILQGNDGDEGSTIMLSSGMLLTHSGNKVSPYKKMNLDRLSTLQEIGSTHAWNRKNFNLVMVDLNNDGQMDLLQKNVNEDTDKPTYAMLSNTRHRERIISTTDGLGRVTGVAYGSLLDPEVYTQTQTTTDPATRYLPGAAGEVARTLIASNLGAANNSLSEYHYRDMRVHRKRGMQGFGSIVTTNKIQKNNGNFETLSEMTHSYRQAFPLTGGLAWSEVRAKKGNGLFLQGKTLINTTATEYALGAGEVKPVSYYVTHQNSTQAWTYGTNGSRDTAGTQLTYDYSAFSDYDSYGNIGKIVTTSTHNLAGTVETTTVNQYSNDTEQWILGRLSQSDVTHHASGAHYRGADVSRKATFTYKTYTGSLESETAYYPGERTKTTTYGYDAQGHQITKTISGTDIDPRTTTFEYSAAYGGRFKTKTINALNHEETTVYDGRLGVPTSTTGPNGLATTWDYDAFGRPKKETRADGTWTETTRHQAVSGTFSTAIQDYRNDPAGGYAQNLPVMAEETDLSSGARSIRYTDASGRVLREVTFVTTNGTNEVALIKQTLYDYQGREWKVSQPTFDQDIVNHSSYRYTEFSYDGYGRRNKETAPGSVVTQYAFQVNGTVKVTDPEGHQLWTRKGQEDRDLWSKDHSGNVVKMLYDASGNPTLTQAGGLNYSVGFDNMGRKTSMSDPDMGDWSYKYNVLDQLTEQEDAKGQKVYFEYDKLGRKTKRWDVPAGQAKSTNPTVAWVYDSANGAGVGKLHYVSGGDLLYRQVTHYDDLGRVRVVNTKTDRNGNGGLEAAENAQEGYTYDAAGRVKTVHNHITGLKTENTYHRNGQLIMVKRVQDMVTTPGAADSYAVLADELEEDIAPVLSAIETKTAQIDAHQTTITTLTQELATLNTAIGTTQLDKADADLAAAEARDTMNAIQALYSVDVPLHVMGLPLVVSSFTDQTQHADYDAAQADYEAAVVDAQTLGEQLVELEAQYSSKAATLSSAQTTLSQIETEIASLQDSIAGKPEALEVLRLSADRVARGQSPVDAIYWKALAFDRWGNATKFKLGNGVETTRTYDPQKATLSQIHAVAGSTDIQKNNYVFDKVGNLVERHDVIGGGIHETFEYDNLYRLESSEITGKFSDNKSWTYQANGNIRNNASRLCEGVTGDCLKYDHAAHPHAVSQAGSVTYQYDANGNMTSSGDGRVISWTSFNKPKTLIQNANAHYASTRSLSFAYGAEHQRIRQVSVLDTDAPDLDAVTETTWYLGNGYLQIEKAGGIVEHHQQIGVPGASVLVVRHDKADGSIKGESTSYLHQDHLGSTSVITGRDTAGKVVVLERQYYDAFGLPLKDSTDSRTAATKSSDITKQGFTGHETLAAFGLIQMNARLYDPVLGRFISADTFIQSPLNLQSYNRYSYVLNNPLSYTDPTGHFFKKLGRALKKAGQWISDNRTMIAMVALTVAFGFGGAAIAANMGLTGAMAGAVGGAIGGGLSGAATAIVSGGSGSDVLQAAVRGAAIGAASGAMFGQIGKLKDAQKLGKIGGVLAHGAAGGVTNMLRGGNAGEAFKSGFISGVVTAGAHESEMIMGLGGGSAAGEVAVSAVIGGTASQLSGGDFANGATTATFQTLYNHLHLRFALEAKKAEHYARNAENDQYLEENGLLGREDITAKELEEKGFKRLEYPEDKFHTMGEGNENNQKWVHANGTSYGDYEIVVRPNGDGLLEHVQDPNVMGTLNYGGENIDHAVKDIIPYYLFGNSSGDTTSIPQRLWRSFY